MKKAVDSGNTKGFLIDGYPRDVQQGEMFEAEVVSGQSFKDARIILSF